MNRKLAEVQKELRELGLKTNAKNPHFKNEYLDLPGLLSQVIPVLEKHNLLLSQTLTSVGEAPALRTDLIDLEEDAVLLSDAIPFVLDRVSPQAVGSAITYYRRYAILVMFNLVAESDDDGEEADKPTRKKTNAPRKPNAKPTKV